MRADTPWADRGPPASVSVSATPLAHRRACTGAFEAHPLPYATDVGGARVHLFDSNGSGVAINDLDADGRLDLVFANLDGPNTIFWNEGGFRFGQETLQDTDSRGVNTVDVDGDGWLDIVFTHRKGGVSFWRNAGSGGSGRVFVQDVLFGVHGRAYSMAWADLGGDHALDLVTASYDADLHRALGNAFLFGGGAGVYHYERRGGEFHARRLTPAAQALAIALPDLDGDARPDLLVGNDFTVRDQAWLRRNDDWHPVAPFGATAESTMSIDEGDIDNDGRPELFAADMKPYDIDTRTLASWLPVMARMPDRHAGDDPQEMTNVLQVRGADGRYRNEAASRGVDATGWSWSAKFGDLDNDGFLDLYVVNGMVAAELFGHLPGDELVERNRALRNQGDGTFAPVPGWGLGDTASGRGMSMADLNDDGRLDVVVNNLRAPARVFENRLCGGVGVEVDLRWPGSRNTRAVGARLALRTDAGTFYRDVRAGSGYLSGDAARIHFGIPASAAPRALEIRWPDGATSAVGTLSPQTLLTVTRR